MTISKPETKTDKTYGDYWSGKKPYLVQDYRKMMQKKTQEEYYFHELHEDPMSELLRPYLSDPNIEGFGWEYQAPPGNLPPDLEPPGGWPPPGDCELACNPTMLDCKGGCNVISCICELGCITPSIDKDPTGTARVRAIDCNKALVCVDEYQTDEEYPEIIVKISDSVRTVKVTVSLVDCPECCDTMEISGDETVDPGDTWTGVISPSCPGNTTCAVSSNSGCTGFSCTVYNNGSLVDVVVPANACGAFTVTVYDDTDNCSNSASATVRINNTGQGGAWTHDASSSDLGVAGCTDTCNCGGGVTNFYTSCMIDEYKYGGYDIGDPCEGTVVTQCKGAGSGSPCNQPENCTDESGSNPCGWAKTCDAEYYPCIYFGWWRCVWECSC